MLIQANENLVINPDTIVAARLVPEVYGALYAAACDGGHCELFSCRFDSPESRPLGFGRASSFAIHPGG